MFLSCLGNSADHFKGSLFRRLLERKFLKELAVDPLLTDSSRWDDRSLQLYSDLVGIELQLGQPIAAVVSGSHRVPGIPGHTGDLFLDPNTGIRYGKQSGLGYVEPARIPALLVNSNVVMVYQASARSGPFQGATLALEAVNQSSGGLSSFAYCGGPASILFFSKEPERVDSMKSWFRDWLGNAPRRILSLN